MQPAALQPVLVTGASGFIGRRLVQRLIEGGCRVSCLVRSNSRVDEWRLAGVPLLTGDVTERGSVERALIESQAATVFHLAGLVRAPRWGTGHNDFVTVNAGGTENIAAACAARLVPPVLVVASSLAAAGPSHADQARVERDAPTPISEYGRGKFAGEEAAAKYASTVPITIVRPPIVFGPGDRAMLQLFRPIARWGIHVVPPSVGGANLESRLSLIHIDDLVEGLLVAAEKGERLPSRTSESGQGIYFVSGEESPTYVQLGQIIAAALEKKSPRVVRVPAPLMKLIGIGGDVLGLIRREPSWITGDKMTEALAGSWTCSSAKAREQLGWSPAANLADRLFETVQWYRQAGWL